MSDLISNAEVYRGVGIHDQQPAERIRRVVKPEIDRVHDMGDIDALAAFASDVSHCPEARLLAGAKCEAIFELAAADRRVRPRVNLEEVRASVAELNSQTWRSPWCHGTLLDTPAAPGKPGAVARNVPLSDDASRVSHPAD